MYQTVGETMKIARRDFLHLVATTAVGLPGSTCLAAQEPYPSRPIQLAVGFPPGGVADLYARVIAQPLSQRLGQPVVVQNKAGAASSLAAADVVRATPDGYTLLYVTAVNSINASLYNNLTFDLERDIVPVASVCRGIGVLVMRPSFPAKTIPEFISYLKANPGKVTMASGGVGSTQHLYGELFMSMAGVKMLHVPYRGGAPALSDLIAGHVQVMFDTLPTSIEFIKAGKLRALGVTSAKRSEVLPGVPAISEFVPGYEADAWHGIGAPRNTPPDIVTKLNTAVNASLTEPAVKSRILAGGYSVFASSPAEFRKYVVAYTEKWAKVIRAAGIKAE